MAEPHTLCQLAQQMERIMQQDPGNRGLKFWAHRGDLWSTAHSLAEASCAVIATGFYITGTNTIETDGPPGALILAQALHKLGINVQLLVDSFSHNILSAGLAALNANIPLIDYANVSLQSMAEVTHFVAIERPGLSSDGNCYNHRGENISPYVAPLDRLFTAAANSGITTIGIGDGGNELGMGCIADKAAVYLRQRNQPDYICCHTRAQYCLCAGVSNWAAYAIAALLSCYCGLELLPEPGVLTDLLEAIVDAGAVDGVTRAPVPTVDGLPQSWELNVYSSLRQLALEAPRAIRVKHA